MSDAHLSQQTPQNVNVHESIRNFSYISDVFKHIEGFNLMGHQIGRKVGDMLELVVMARIHSDPELRSRIMYEPKIEGFTGAGHKVEFGFYEKSESGFIDVPFGFIECKRVGVEVTKDSSIKSSFLKLKKDGNINVNFSSAWLAQPVRFQLTISKVNDVNVEVTVKANMQEPISMIVQIKEHIRLVVDERNNVYIIKPQENLRNIPEIIRICKIISLEAIQSDLSFWGVWDCLTGPQTIEKAKQAAFVAMDVRRKVDGKWGMEDLEEEDKTFTPILVITEASHWEIKSRKVIGTCIDHNIIVPDEIIVEAFRLFEEKFGLENILNYITKNLYKENEEIRNVLSELLDKFKGKLFYDLNLGTYVDFKYEKGKLVVYQV